MAYTIDISAQLEAARPVIQLGEGESYELNDDKKNILLVQKQIEKLEGADGEDAFASLDALLVGYFGKKNLALIEERHPGATTRIASMRVLVQAASAAIQGISYEDAEKSFRT